jgi:hypothetical protein
MLAIIIQSVKLYLIKSRLQKPVPSAMGQSC